jgi:hypothetical protein
MPKPQKPQRTPRTSGPLQTGLFQPVSASPTWAALPAEVRDAAITLLGQLVSQAPVGTKAVRVSDGEGGGDE